MHLLSNLEVNCQKSNFSTPSSVRFHNYPLYSIFKLKTGNFENILKADNRPVLHDQRFLRNGDVPHPAAVCVSRRCRKSPGSSQELIRIWIYRGNLPRFRAKAGLRRFFCKVWLQKFSIFCLLRGRLQKYKGNPTCYFECDFALESNVLFGS